MKRFAIWLFPLLCGLELVASGAWTPRVSVDDDWRWTGLDFLNDYEIINGTRGLNDDVWFVHQGGILHYDGQEVRNHPVPRLANQSIGDIRYMADGRIMVTTSTELIVWTDGQHTVLSVPDAGQIIRNGIAERKDGRVFAAIHAEKLSLNTPESIAAWVVKQGVDKAKFMEQFNSFAVATKATKGTQLQNAYKVEGVPAIGVAGRFYTDGTFAKNMDRALVIAEFLAAEIRKKK